LALYNEKYGAIDPTFKVIAQVPTGELTSTHSVDNSELIYNSETFREFYSPQDMFHLAGTWLIRNEHRSALLGFQRSKTSPEYQLEVLSQVRELVPHFQKALHIYRTHTEAVVKNDAFASGIDTMQMGIIFFNHQSEVSYCNKSASSIINYHPAIDMRNKSIYATADECNKTLRKAISAASQANQFGTFIKPYAIGLKHPAAFTPLPVLITPIHQSELSVHLSKGPVAAVMTISDPDRILLTSPELLSTIYDLTQSEAEVAIHLANAMSPKEIAELKGVKITTIRSQVQSVFAKMGVKTQAQLIKILLCSPLTSTMQCPPSKNIF